MNKTKKIVCVFLTVLFCTGLIAGCADGSAAETSSTPTIISTENEQATPSAEATATPTATGYRKRPFWTAAAADMNSASVHLSSKAEKTDILPMPF